MLSKSTKALYLTLLILISVTVISMAILSMWLGVIHFFGTIFLAASIGTILLALWDVIVKIAVIGITFYVIFLVWTRPVRRSVRGKSNLPFNRKKK